MLNRKIHLHGTRMGFGDALTKLQKLFEPHRVPTTLVKTWEILRDWCKEALFTLFGKSPGWSLGR